MKKRMLDTNICIYIIKNRPEHVRKKFEVFGIGDLCLSTVTVSELMYGVYKSQHREKNMKALEMFLQPFDILEYDYAASVHYGEIRANLESQGRVIGGLDMQIAAHARSLDMILVTNNLKEFERVEALALENWV